MGYTTKFDGWLRFNKTPSADALEQWREAINTSTHDRRIKGMPSSYCQWEFFKKATSECFLKWDGEEKFYDYINWLDWLLKNIFLPNELSLSGTTLWQGEDVGDVGLITVIDGKVHAMKCMDYYHTSAMIMSDLLKIAMQTEATKSLALTSENTQIRELAEDFIRKENE
jgi:hypothetical protein